MKNKIKAIILVLISVLNAFIMIFNTNTLKAEGENVTSPIIWYDFNDEANYGKDKVGNENLIIYGDANNIVKGDKGISFKNNTMYAKSISDKNDFSDYLSSFTISLFFKPTSDASTSRILCTGNYQKLDGFVLFLIKNENGLYLVPDINTTSGINGVSDGHFKYWFLIENVNEWQHFAVSVNSKTNKIIYYLNGNEVANFNNEVLMKNTDQAFSLFGITHTNGGGHTDFYNGFLDDVRIYDFAMNSTQLSKIKQGTLTDLNINEETISKIEIEDANDIVLNSILKDEFVYRQLPKKAIIYSSNNNKKEADILWSSYKNEINKGKAYGYILNSPFINDKGLLVSVEYKISNDAELPLIMSPVFTNNMVLQRGTCRVFGMAGNTSVTVELVGQDKKTVDVKNTTFEIELNLKESIVPTQLIITTLNDEKIVYDNVLVGEVWYCSGQSNMDFNVFQTSGDTLNKLKEANYENIRFMKRSMYSSFEPIDIYTDKWLDAKNFNDVLYMSAFASSFALNLKENLKNQEGKDVPVGIISAAIGGSGIEQWLSKETIKEVGSRINNNEGKYDTEYYYGMNYSVRNTSIRGILWYQGEDNAFYPSMYKKQLKGYVKDMKAIFNNDDLAFIIAQLPQYDINEWVEFRQAQWEASEEIENLYVCCGIDLGEYHDIHPQKDKYLFATRAAQIASKYVYNDKDASGVSPYPTSITYKNNKITIKVSNGLELKSKYKGEIDGFEVLVDGKWMNVKATILNNSIVLDGFNGKASKVRYFNLANTSKYDNKGGFNYIYNKFDLPLAPFNLAVEATKYKVNVSSLHGNVSTTNEFYVEEGKDATIKIDVESGYKIKSVIQDGKEIFINGNIFTTFKINNDSNIIINYEKVKSDNRFNIEVINDNSCGELKLSQNEFASNESIIGLINVKENYEIDYVLVNGNVIEVNNNTFVLNNANTNLTIKVVYKEVNNKQGCKGFINPQIYLLAVAFLICLKRKEIKTL
ncbi:MAG: sialate O-acetylesterase [Candidatus Caccosoma sp.]|nr:sialate O-acetylesterase [Candidatus Caccosoma sp.]